MRFWGQIMAAIYSSIDETKLTYMDFYMDSYKERVLPEYTDIDVEPADVEKVLPGMLLQEDAELINSSVQMGMGLMTLDKVIKAYVELIESSNGE